jgi:hypothetical protein
MSSSEILAALGGVAGVVAGALFLGKLVAEKSADAVIKRFESSLKRAEEEHKSSLNRVEAEHASSLNRMEEGYKTSLSFGSAIDTDLRTRRIPVYGELWEKTGTLPLWPRNSQLQYSDLDQLTRDLRDWYFKRGGMYLSKAARDAYGELQKHMMTVLEKRPSGQVTDADYVSIRERCSALRTELTRDLLSRREAPDLPRP